VLQRVAQGAQGGRRRGTTNFDWRLESA
jgi:hypothetical protein